MFVFVLLLPLAFCYAIWLYQEHLKLSKMTRDIPTLPGCKNVVGHLPWSLCWDLFGLIAQSHHWINYNRGIAKIWIGPKLVFVVSDPKLSLSLSNSCLKKDKLYKFTESWIGQGLVVADVPRWKTHRKLLNATFSQHVLDSFLDVFNRESMKLVEVFKTKIGSDPFDPHRELGLASLKTICQTAIGLSAEDDTLVDKEYGQAVDRIMEIYIYRFRRIWMHLNFLYKFTQTKKEEDRTVKILKAMPSQVLKRKKLEMGHNYSGNSNTYVGRRFKAFLDLLLELGRDGLLTDQEIADHVDAMIMAGYDTNSTAMTFILIVLKCFPEVQEKVYQEIIEVIGKSERTVMKEDLSKLVYMEAVIKETLRLYPIGPIIAREAEDNVKCENFTIPAGCTVFFNIWGMHRHPCWGPTASQFLPERWLQPDLLPKEPAAFSAFSLGKRGCIGRTYAMMSMKTTLVHLLRNFKITGTPRKILVKIDVLLKPKGGGLIELTNRLSDASLDSATIST